MPRRAGGGNEALVHRRVLRIGQTIGHRPLALNPNGHTKEAVGAAVAPQIRRSRRKTAGAQARGVFLPLVAPKAKLRRILLLLFEYPCHNPRPGEPLPSPRRVDSAML